MRRWPSYSGPTGRYCSLGLRAGWGGIRELLVTRLAQSLENTSDNLPQFVHTRSRADTMPALELVAAVRTHRVRSTCGSRETWRAAESHSRTTAVEKRTAVEKHRTWGDADDLEVGRGGIEPPTFRFSGRDDMLPPAKISDEAD
jgi:hypothetical protein